MRKSAFVLLILCCGALMIAACGKKAPENKKSGTPPSVQTKEGAQKTITEWGDSKIYRGFAVFGHEVRSFQPCGSSTIFWVSDHSGQFWEMHYDIVPHSDPSAQVFAIVEASQGPPPDEGLGSDYPGTLLIEEIFYMTHEGLGCKTYWNNFHFRASGNEPFWTAEVNDRELRLTRMGEPDRTLSGITQTRFENGFKYVCGENGETATLIITSIPCRDSMSGAYFGYNATLKSGSETLRGCAVPGRDPSSLPE